MKPFKSDLLLCIPFPSEPTQSPVTEAPPATRVGIFSLEGPKSRAMLEVVNQRHGANLLYQDCDGWWPNFGLGFHTLEFNLEFKIPGLYNCRS